MNETPSSSSSDRWLPSLSLPEPEPEPTQDGWACMDGWMDGWMRGCVVRYEGNIFNIHIVGCTVEMYSEEKACTIRPIATAYRGGELVYNTGH